MPVDFRKFQSELKNQGYSVERTNQGHYWVIRPDGGKLINFAVGHGSNKGMVLDAYVREVRKAVAADK